MSSLTYDTSSVVTTAETAPRKGWWRTFIDAVVAARMKQAEQEIARHSHLIPRELDLAGWKVEGRSEDSLPFVK